MTEAINPKLLVLLGLTVVLGGIGAWRLLSVEDVQGDVGFGPANELPIVVAPSPEVAEPVGESVGESVESTGRNPFARADGGESITPVPNTTQADIAAATDTPAFPDPALVDQGPSRNDPREDTSFEG